MKSQATLEIAPLMPLSGDVPISMNKHNRSQLHSQEIVYTKETISEKALPWIPIGLFFFIGIGLYLFIRLLASSYK